MCCHSPSEWQVATTSVSFTGSYIWMMCKVIRYTNMHLSMSAGIYRWNTHYVFFHAVPEKYVCWEVVIRQLHMGSAASLLERSRCVCARRAPSSELIGTGSSRDTLRRFNQRGGFPIRSSNVQLTPFQQQRCEPGWEAESRSASVLSVFAGG